jgi:hypothetical protein
MKHIRCEAIVVQIIGTEYDAMNRPIGEHTLPPMKVFRATARDFWPQIDKAVSAAVKAAEEDQKKAAAVTPSSAKPKTKPTKGAKKR